MFDHIDTWVFDLDNTLYPKAAALFDQIDIKMTNFVMRETGLPRDEADDLRQKYYYELGTTLAGLMRDYNTSPDGYLYEVHEIDLSHLAKDAHLNAQIKRLPGRKIIHTNGSRFHAERVTKARGLFDAFDEIYGVEHVSFVPKPHRDAFDQFYAMIGADPAKAAFFEDEPRNLKEPFHMGVTTILVDPEDTHDHVHHHVDDLTAFLERINTSHAAHRKNQT